MEARSLFAVVALVFLLWMIRTWVRWDLQSRRARKSREQLRNRVSNSAFVERVRPAARVANSDNASEQNPAAVQQISSPSALGEHDEVLRLQRKLSQVTKDLDHARSQLSKNLLQSRASSDHDVDKLSVTVDNLKAQLRAQAQQIQRQVHAVEQVDKLKKQMFDKHRELEQIKQTSARNEESLSQFRNGAQKAAMLEQLLASQRLQNERLDNELARLRNEIKNRDSQIQQFQNDAHDRLGAGEQAALFESDNGAIVAARDQLRQQLQRAESAAAHSGQSDLEIRRLKSELQALVLDRPDSQTHIDAIRKRLQALPQDDTGVRVGNKSSDRTDARKKEVQSTGGNQALYKAPEYQDDLKKIKGIGPVMERTLNDLGVTTFEQLANFTQDDVDKVSAAIGAFPGRIERDDWVGKAKIQQHQKYGQSA